MREVAQIVLQLVRHANRNHLNVSPVLPELMACLQVTDEEHAEIAEILKADIREMNATYPAYGRINEQLKKWESANPDGN